ncbi:hypothetical protein FQA39_LY02555 [Lamprigera yunnana]|nr:hypothetical protein FQA39_LY02555 [Lamprigera yunnana]
MNENDIEQVAIFMGYTQNIHKHVYRLSNNIDQTAKILKLLLLMEKGKAAKYKGKALDQIELDLEIKIDSRDSDDDNELSCVDTSYAGEEVEVIEKELENDEFDETQFSVYEIEQSASFDLLNIIPTIDNDSHMLRSLGESTLIGNIPISNVTDLIDLNQSGDEKIDENNEIADNSEETIIIQMSTENNNESNSVKKSASPAPQIDWNTCTSTNLKAPVHPKLQETIQGKNNIRNTLHSASRKSQLLKTENVALKFEEIGNINQKDHIKMEEDRNKKRT